jgi:hypothetical protein
MYKTRLASNEIFSPSNKIHWEVGRAKDLSAPRYKHLRPWLSKSCHSVSIVRNCTYLIWANITLRHMSIILTVFRWFSTCIALGDVDLLFSLILVTQGNAVERGTKSTAWLYHQRKEHVQVTDGVRVTSLSAGLQYKTSAAKDRVCQIVLNRKLYRIVHDKSR